MPRFEVAWKAYGIAEVRASSPEEAERMVSEGCFDWSGDIDWEDNQVDGVWVEA